MSDKRSIYGKGWAVTFVGLGINLVLGVLYAWSVMGKALVGEWKWTKAQASLPFMASSVVFAVMMIFAGRLQDRIGPRIVATLGGLLLGAGLLASSLAKTPEAMMLTFGFLGGMGIGLGYSATTPSAIKWFPPHMKGLITGIVVAGVGIAAVYISPLTRWLLGPSNNISYTFVVLGAGTIVIVTVLSRFLMNPPPGFQPGGRPPAPAPGAKPASLRGTRDSDWHEMLRTPQFYRLWLMFVFTASAGLMVIGNLAVIAKMQAGWEWGFLAVSVLAVFNTIGRLAGGHLSDRIGRTRAMVVFFALQAVNMLLFAHYKTPNLLLFGAAFTGFAYGSLFALMPAATAEYYGVKNLGVNYGLVFSSFGVAAFVGATVAGLIADKFKSFDHAYQLNMALLVLGILIALTTKPPKREESGAQPQ
jgi:MFS transporter, OFA family, oxalate/formate antiporter